MTKVSSVNNDSRVLMPKIDSEIGPLRTVIVHCPGREVERLTPKNHDALLFDDLLSPGPTTAEHTYFVESMRENNIEVLEFTDLLIEALRDDEARHYVLTNTVNRKRLGPLLSPTLEEWAAGLPPEQVAALCVGGITLEEWRKISPASSLVAEVMEDDDFLISPLPNHLFTRDTSVWAYGGVAINSMRRPARQREALHYSAIYRWHPLFKGADFHFWTEGNSGAERSLEGGDIIVLGNGLLMVGLTERTSPQGIERLATRIFNANRAERVLAVMIPHRREFMHLDTVITQLDHDAFIVYPAVAEAKTIVLARDGDRGVRLEEIGRPLCQALEEEMGRPLRFITPDASTSDLAREQWNDGFNMLALSPGKVVAYDRTPLANQAMRDAGIEVLEIGGSELGRGRGGPRCMSCPVVRDSLV